MKIKKSTHQQKLEATVLVCALSNNKTKRTKNRLITINKQNHNLSLIMTFEELFPLGGFVMWSKGLILQKNISETKRGKNKMNKTCYIKRGNPCQ